MNKNIFSALANEKTSGTIMEFSLWCSSLVVVVLSLIATIIGKGNLTWIMLMLFAIGFAVLTAFRLKAIAMLYNVCCFSLITVMIQGIYCLLWASYMAAPIAVINIVLFVIVMCLAVAICVFQFVQAFTKKNFANLLTILVIIHSALTLLLDILYFAIPVTGDSWDASIVRDNMNYHGYWIGTVTLWLMLIIVTLFHIFSFWGSMSSNHGKIVGGQATRAGLQGISGNFANQFIPMEPDRQYILGAGNNVNIKFMDNRVSGNHCRIAFDSANNYYRIMDESTNGTYLGNGQRLTQGTWISVAKGNVIMIGSNAQRLKLM